MKNLRLRMMLLVGWLIVLFGSQLIFEPIGVHRTTYLFIAAEVTFLLIAPKFSGYPSRWVGGISAMIYSAIKIIMGEFLIGAMVVYTITELSFVVVSAILAQWINQAISEFESAIVDISIGCPQKSPDQAQNGQEILYREVRRARNHQRPLTLMAICVDDRSIHPAMNHLMREAQSELMKQVVLSGIAKILCEKLEDCDIVVQDHHRFLAVLPEMIPDNLPFLVRRLQQQAVDQMGIELQIGTACLPVDGFTLEGLINKATQNITATQLESASLEADHPKTKRQLE